MAADLVYGVKLMTLTEVNADGSAKTGGKVVKITAPQQVSFEAQVTEGNRVEQRGGDALVCVVEEDDEIWGMNATFTEAKLSLEAMALIIGAGTTTGTSPDITAFEAPTLATQKAGRTPFKAEVYATEYSEGVHDEGDIEGYIKITLPLCKGRVPSFSQQDRNFVVPSYTLRSRETATMGCYKIEKIASLPA
jgi:hypothetical protein